MHKQKLKSGEDYSPESSETDSPRKITKTETRGPKPKVSARSKSSKEAGDHQNSLPSQPFSNFSFLTLTIS
jgi:hypothetical protein